LAIVEKYAPKRLPQKPQVRYHKSQKQPMRSGDLQVRGDLNHQEMLDQLKRHYDYHDMKQFYAVAERVLRIKNGSP
jgi:hypothetical protein